MTLAPVTATLREHTDRPNLTAVPRETKPAPVDKSAVKAKLPYYDYGPLLSHHAVYNFIVGGRGLGKTYGAKRRAIRRAISHGEKFIYVRRYKNELAPVRDTFWADVQHEFPGWQFQTRGNLLEMAPVTPAGARVKPEWRVIGYLIALSVAQQYKSVAYPEVKTIIFDEFIIEKGVVRYITDETTVFNNFYSTVDRWLDKTTVFFLANSVSINNPYFLEYGILPKEENPEFLKLLDGFLLCHFPKAEDFANAALSTRFGRFIDGTDYARFAVGNEFSDNHAELIAVKTPDAKYSRTLETRLGAFSLWYDFSTRIWYAQHKRPGNENYCTLLPERMGEGKTLLLYNDDIIANLRTLYRHGWMRFDDPATRNMFLDVFRKKA